MYDFVEMFGCGSSIKGQNFLNGQTQISEFKITYLSDSNFGYLNELCW